MKFKHHVSFTCPRGLTTARGTVLADVIDDGMMASFDDMTANTSVREISLFIRSRDWSAVTADLPRIADKVTLEDGAVFSVFAVTSLNASIISVRARKC